MITPVCCATCGAPIPLEAHLEHMRRMNRARVDLALSFGCMVTPDEKVFLSNGSLVPKCVEGKDDAA